jgi:hypothetical protein
MKVSTKIGDVFVAQVNEKHKKYFQLVAFDLTQMNSDVIRVFDKLYMIHENPQISDIINDEVTLYAHCVTKLGIKLKLWERIGNTTEIGDVDQILFKDTRDYGRMENDEPILISKNWYIWHINKKFKNVGKLEGENKKAHIGLIINPLGIIELLKGNKYPINYPDF